MEDRTYGVGRNYRKTKWLVGEVYFYSSRGADIYSWEDAQFRARTIYLEEGKPQEPVILKLDADAGMQRKYVTAIIPFEPPEELRALRMERMLEIRDKNTDG